MKKTITALIIGLAVTMGTGIALAKNIPCTVVQVEGSTVTLQCKSADGLSEGDKVKLRTVAKKAIEGC